MAETSEFDRLSRDLAEAILSAYAQQAEGTLHQQQEQALLARLAEALRPVVECGSASAATEAANAALGAWEQAEPGIGGPRIAGLDMEQRQVRLTPPRT